MKKLHTFILIIITACIFQSCTNNSSNNDEFTIYLVRHAEKVLEDKTDKNPDLTACGKERAAFIANYLKNEEIETIFSSNYKRTNQTAQPTVSQKDIEVTIYDAGNLEEIKNLLLQQKENALVVGHSNTTPNLAGMLTNQELNELDESIYNLIYKVTISNKGNKLEVIETDFACD